MNIPDIRNVLLTAFGNAFLQGKNVSFDNRNPAAYGLSSIKFVHDLPGEQAGWIEYLANNPNDWFQYLKNEGYKRLYVSDTETAGIEWAIFTVKDNEYDIWSNKTVIEKGFPRTLYYIEKNKKGKPEIAINSLEKSKLELKKILEGMITFTIKTELKNWQSIFERALSQLFNDKENELLEEGVLPEGCFEIDSKQIISACNEAWVFGGMGSWSDVTFQDNDIHQEYEDLSYKLYSILRSSLFSVINNYPK